MQIKKLAETLVGSLERKVEDSKSSELRVSSPREQKELFQNHIDVMEKRQEKERDAAWINFGTSIVAAGTTFGMGAGSAAGAAAGSAASAAATVDLRVRSKLKMKQ